MSLTTPQQPVFEVMRASAGSGKTFSLVRRYMECCLGHESDVYFRHILAITFTNKAADEMKHRVIEGVRELSIGESKHEAYLLEVLSMETSELRQKAASVHESMLTHYGQIAILTIDKFVNRLVRSFTRELTLDGDFKLELDQERLIGTAVDELLSRVGGEEKELTTILEKYTLQKVEDEDNWKLRKDLVRFGKLLFKEETRPVLEQLQDLEPETFTQLHETYFKEVQVARAKAKKAADSALAEAKKNDFYESDFSRSNAFKFFREFSEGLDKLPSDALRKILLEVDDANLYTGKWAKANPERVADMDRLHEHFSACAQEVLRYFEGPEGEVIQLKKELLKSLYPLAVLQQLDLCLALVREKQNTFTFSDLNYRLEQLVKSGPAPFIYERIGERYHHFFIDEFQDTSVVQWLNFLPLLDNSLAQGFHNLVVGDGKQAIYRWRNGDVRQLQHLPQLLRKDSDEMHAWEESLSRYYKEEFLEENWRSTQRVVDFNNTIFEGLQNLLGEAHQGIYAHQAQTPMGPDGGWVTVEGFKPPSSSYGEEEVSEKHEERHERICKLIDRNLEAGYALSDIAVLVRNRKVGSALSRYLIRAGYSTITEESLQLSKHVAPLAAIYLLKSLFQPEDQGNKVRFVQCYCAFHPEMDPGHMLAKYIEIPEKGRSRFDLIAFLSEELKWEQTQALLSMDLFSCMEEVVSKLGIGTAFSAYAERLLQLALSYQIDESGGLSGFLEYWDEEASRKSITVPESTDGIRVLTVHKSKGLEYPVVISLITKPSRGGGEDLLPVRLDPERFYLPVGLTTLTGMRDTWAHDQYEEEKNRDFLDELNVYYVSLTRAKYHLHVILEANPDAKKKEGIEHAFGNVLQDFCSPEDIYADQVELGSPLKKQEPSPVSVSKSKTRFVQLNHANPGDRLKVSIDDATLRSEGDTLSARAFGDELHRLLSFVRTASDFSDIEKQTAPWQRMSETEWGDLLKKVKEVLAHAQAEVWFRDCDEVLNERELLDADGKVHRPDRVFRKQETWFVVDYKSGKKEKKHLQQVKAYAEALKNNTGEKVEGYLLYTDSMEVVAVS